MCFFKKIKLNAYAITYEQAGITVVFLELIIRIEALSC